jgi:hypothetical protein
MGTRLDRRLRLVIFCSALESLVRIRTENRQVGRGADRPASILHGMVAFSPVGLAALRHRRREVARRHHHLDHAALPGQATAAPGLDPADQPPGALLDGGGAQLDGSAHPHRREVAAPDLGADALLSRLSSSTRRAAYSMSRTIAAVP